MIRPLSGSLACAFFLILPVTVLSQSFSQDETFATVGSATISSKTFNQALVEAISAGRTDSPQLRIEVRNILVNQELLVQKALIDGVDKKPQHANALENLRRNYLVQAMLRENLEKNPIVEDELRRAYDETYAELLAKKQNEYNLTTWTLDSERSALELIRKLTARLPSAEINKALSSGESLRTRRGEWVVESMLVEPIANQLVRLKKGQHSTRPVKLGEHWYVVQLQDKRLFRVPNFDEAKPSLMNRLIQQRQVGYLAQLRSEIPISVNH